MIKSFANKFNKRGVRGWVGTIRQFEAGSQLPLFSISSGIVRKTQAQAYQDAEKIARGWR